MRRTTRALVACALVAHPLAAEIDGQATLVVEPREATVGDHLAATLVVDVAADVDVEATPIGPRLGPFVVVGETWAPAETAPDGGRRYRWSATLSAFETGDLEVPAIAVRGRRGEGTFEITTVPVPIVVRSVLESSPEDAPPEIADLKPPASMPPDYGTLYVALGLLGLLVAGATVVWWLNRRLAGRLSAVPVPDDPFHRESAHAWVYRELKRLLDRRLAEEGRIDEFYAEIGRIVKTYLGGRYRLDLLERTTDEVLELLRQAGAPDGAAEHAHELLVTCDFVKFARRRPDATGWREIVETLYALVDATRAPDAGRGVA